MVAQRGLREARLCSRTRLHLLTTWEALTQLRSLELVAPCILLAPGAALPASLTALTLAGDRGPHLPHQVRTCGCCSGRRGCAGAALCTVCAPACLPAGQASGARYLVATCSVAHQPALLAEQPLPPPALRGPTPHGSPPSRGLQVGELSNLRRLRLRGVAYGSGGFEVLRRMASLEHLQLDRCRLPACLPALASLRSLHLCACTAEPGCEAELAAGVAAALRRLGQLTALALVQLPLAACLPPAMAALRQLQSLTVLPSSGSAAGGCSTAALPSCMLPPPWPAGLRSLTAPFALVSASQAWLSAARQLSRLCLTDCPSASGIAPSTWLTFFGWAEVHAPLGSLEFAAPPPQHAALLGKACARLAAKRPALRLTVRPPGKPPALAPPAGWTVPAPHKR